MHNNKKSPALWARYLVGADGASSKVHNLIVQDFEGQSCVAGTVHRARGAGVPLIVLPP